MRRFLLTAGMAVLLAAPASLAAQYHHGEVGAYGDLFRVAPTGGSAANYLGLGGRVGFNTGKHVVLEAEMNYDFEKDFTTTSSSGATTTTVTARVRPILGLFGPKFQLGAGGFRAFVEGKIGFLDLSTSCNAAAGSPSCFTGSLSNFGGANTHFAAFPGGGLAYYWGPFGVRVDAGDELWWNGGTNNNLRMTFGPTFRF